MNTKLKEARKRKGLTQQQMADKLGYKTKSGYSNIENSPSDPPVRTALRIARILEVDPFELFDVSKDQATVIDSA